jgi:hypothetical protein
MACAGVLYSWIWEAGSQFELPICERLRVFVAPVHVSIEDATASRCCTRVWGAMAADRSAFRPQHSRKRPRGSPACNGAHNKYSVDRVCIIKKKYKQAQANSPDGKGGETPRDSATHTRTHTHARAHTLSHTLSHTNRYTGTHTDTQTHTDTHTHAHTHTHTHTRHTRRHTGTHTDTDTAHSVVFSTVPCHCAFRLL